ncbi:MAG: divalent-cation tolerance protein CutA [Nitrospirota bacterium]|nr:divalent-cation tolerance protein CutA [Nitrospirota bacterium]
MTDAVVVLITAGSEEEGAKIADALVAEHLAACVNLIPGIQSRFFWEGRVQQAAECLLICKTAASAVDRLIARIRELHSYSVPEVIAIPVIAGLPSYLTWVSESTIS